jgi:ribosomal-protein-alanine N-acetyltransferase
MELPQIETARLRLRPYTLDNLEDLHCLWTDPDVRRYLFDNKMMSRGQAASDIQRSIACFQINGFGEWAVCLKGKEPLIGFCGFRFIGDPSEVELLYGLAPAYWSQGLTTEAARAVLRYGFEEHNLSCIVASADAPNVASLRVMEKVGMRFERRVRKHNLDLLYYALLREAFQWDDSYYSVQPA